ncbi:cation diffusion facilitator family transporter [Pseudactinotalea sp. HY158]|uniref:cation diffusion facilitator family transporter n=1 Tax=unclassified Pseudactinotalea TaxID=2649176 RepID=UPI00351AACC2
MAHSHGTPTAGTAAGQHRSRLIVVLVITGVVVVFQLVGAIVSSSLALLADAGHMLTDATGVLIALVAITLASRPATDSRTWGLMRAEILAALVNAVILGGMGVYVIVTALARWDSPPEVATTPMLIAAGAGLVANAISLTFLHGSHRESVNMRGAYLEVLGDLVGSVAVIVAGIVIATTGYQRADIFASLGIGLFILPRAWSLLREVTHILLEATPKGLDLARVREHIRSVEGVIDVHDLHAWTITSGMPALTAHVVVEPEYLAECGPVLDRVTACLEQHFDLGHTTLQLEPVGHAAHEVEPGC